VVWVCGARKPKGVETRVSFVSVGGYVDGLDGDLVRNNVCSCMHLFKRCSCMNLA
jgi:hypothetical protein